jgi:two-component system sensor histidine kinase NreB
VDAAIGPDLSSDEQLVLYQVAKEAMLNALKHANPNQVSVRLGERGTSVFLEVVDDGEGFNPRDVDTSRHFGLGLIRERVKRQNGRLDLTSEKGRGTSLSVYLPREISPENLAPHQS